MSGTAVLAILTAKKKGHENNLTTKSNTINATEDYMVNEPLWYKLPKAIWPK
jgi:tRNA A37 threonylcarbamoyladenosine synthetase subunit TsaC/SUA5/YrdC